MDIGVLCVCAHCGFKEFFSGAGVNSDLLRAVDRPTQRGWKTIKTADQELELCPDCYDMYSAMVRAFRLRADYKVPNIDRSKKFTINEPEESDIDGSEQPAEEQPALKPADTAAESIARAEAIREAGGDRCQGL